MLVTEPGLTGTAGIGHGFLGRQGGVSLGPFASLNLGLRGGDDPVAVLANRATAARLVGRAPERLAIARQVHGVRCVRVEAAWDALEAPEADALVTGIPGLVLGVLTADCAPVLMADPEAGVVAAAHAGWKGALGGVLEAALAGMAVMGARSERVRAAIGPCIGPASYEVGDDYRKQFEAADPASAACFSSAPAGARPLFDLALYCRSRLARAGIIEIGSVGLDTCALPDLFFSHRRSSKRDDTRFGLQLSAIFLR